MKRKRSKRWNNELQKYAFFLMIAHYLSMPDLLEFSLCSSKIHFNLHLKLCEFNQYLIDTCMLNFLLKNDEEEVLSNNDVRKRMINKIKFVYSWSDIKYLKPILEFFGRDILKGQELCENYMAHQFLLNYEQISHYPLLPKDIVDFYLASDKFETQFSQESKLEYQRENHQLIFDNETIISDIKLPLFFGIFFDGVFTLRLNTFDNQCKINFLDNKVMFYYELGTRSLLEIEVTWSPEIFVIIHQNIESHFSVQMNPGIEPVQIQVIPYFLWLK
jgi:hypothetical protein